MTCPPISAATFSGPPLNGTCVNLHAGFERDLLHADMRRGRGARRRIRQLARIDLGPVEQVLQRLEGAIGRTAMPNVKPDVPMM